MFNRYGMRVYGQTQQNRNEPLRAFFQQSQLQNYGIWVQLIPHQIKMIITQFGTGPTPKAGEFLRLKQLVYLDNMSLVKAQRMTYPFGRGKTLPGLQICLAMCRQGFRARCFLSSQYAYGNQKVAKIPANSSLVIDIQILGIFKQPQNKDQFEDKLLIDEIKYLAKEGDQLVQNGDLRSAQLKFQEAFMHIQSTRCKQIKHHLYTSNTNKQNYHRNQEEIVRVNRGLEKDKQQLVGIFKIFDIIKIKAVEVALLNKDYYKVIILSKQCLMESRLQLNQRILVARGRAFAEVGEFNMALELARNLCDKYRDNAAYREELLRIQTKKEIVERQMIKKMQGQPVVTFQTDEQTFLQKLQKYNQEILSKKRITQTQQPKQQQEN